MDPYYEQRLREEVIYLHSLWHRGPPRPAGAAAHNLQPSNTTQFKKDKSSRHKRGKNSKQKPKSPNSELKSSPGNEWHCPTPPAPISGWGSFGTLSNQEPKSISAEVQDRILAQQAQQGALESVIDFFRSRNMDEAGDIVDSSDEDDELTENDAGLAEYGFFVNLFNDDTKLREYYKKNYANGEFNCLVCGAVGGKKTGKKFKNCLALVQHSVTVNRTKRHAHRIYSQAICKILYWELDRLPTIASDLAIKSNEVQRSANNGDNMPIVLSNNVDSVCGNPVEIAPGGGSDAPNIFPDDRQQNMLSCENTSASPDSKRSAEGLGKLAAYNVDEPVEDLGRVISDSAAEPLEDISRVIADNAVERVEDQYKVVADNIDKPAVDEAKNEPLKENSVVENEVQDSQKDPAILDGLKEDIQS